MSITIEMCIMMTEPQLNCSFYFIIQHRVISSKMFLQFGKEMKFKKCQVMVTSKWWNQHAAISTVVLVLVCSWALSCWRKGGLMWGWTPQSHAFTIPNVSQYCLELMVAPVGMNSECTMPLMSQKPVGVILPADFAVLKYFLIAGYLFDGTPLTVSCCQVWNGASNFHLLFKNLSFSCS